MKKGLFVICMAALFATSCTQTGKTEEDRFIEDLLSQMTLEEKIGQMNQIHFDKSLDSIKAQVRNGELGSMLNIDPKLINEIQKTAVEESRLGIPLIIGRDIVHGYKTVLPFRWAWQPRSTRNSWRKAPTWPLPKPASKVLHGPSLPCSTSLATPAGDVLPRVWAKTPI